MIRLLIGFSLIFITSNLLAEPPTGFEPIVSDVPTSTAPQGVPVEGIESLIVKTKSGAVYKVEKVQRYDGSEGFLIRSKSGEKLGVFQPASDDELGQWAPAGEAMAAVKVHVILQDAKKNWSGGAIHSECHE